MTVELAISIGLKADQCDGRIKIETEKVQGLADADLALARQQHAIDNDANAAKIASLERRLEKATAWYRSPLFVSLVTTGAVVGAMLAVRYLVIETQPPLPGG